MAKTKNEIRERNGKIVLLICMLFFLSILGIYSLIMILYVKNIDDTVGNFAKTLAEVKKVDNVKNDTIELPSFMTKGERNLFVGGERKEDIQIVNGIEIEAIDSMRFNYKIDFLENWKKIDQIKGTAVLDIDSAKSDTFLIERQSGRAYFVYKFIDNMQKCNLEILISKSKYSNSSIAQVRENCDGNTKNITPILFYK